MYVTLQKVQQHKVNVYVPLKSKAIIIFGLCILCDPEHNCRQHQSHVLRYVRVAIVCVLFRVVLHDIFEHEERLDGPIIKCLAASNRKRS